jgi:hypothetical protein
MRIMRSFLGGKFHCTIINYENYENKIGLIKFHYIILDRLDVNPHFRPQTSGLDFVMTTAPYRTTL